MVSVRWFACGPEIKVGFKRVWGNTALVVGSGEWGLASGLGSRVWRVASGGYAVVGVLSLSKYLHQPLYVVEVFPSPTRRKRNGATKLLSFSYSSNGFFQVYEAAIFFLLLCSRQLFHWFFFCLLQSKELGQLRSQCRLVLLCIPLSLYLSFFYRVHIGRKTVAGNSIDYAVC